jgi:hypothetical protein
LDQPWAENDEYIMVSGVGGSLNNAPQVATAGLSNWLESYYRLYSAEVATFLANTIHYDIAEIVDPQVPGARRRQDRQSGPESTLKAPEPFNHIL